MWRPTQIFDPVAKLTLNPRLFKSNEFICGLNYTKNESLVKFRPLVSNNVHSSHNKLTDANLS